VTQPNFSRPGAIDLSSLRKPATPPGGAAPPAGSAGAGSFVLDVTEPTFQADVIERSIQVPVVVEFWSPRSAASTQLARCWSGCRPSTAVKFLLARIDIDANPQLAQAVGVQTVPLVIAVLRGQVVPLFQGPVGEPEARQYLDQLLTVAVANGITGRTDPVGPGVPAPEEPEIDPRYAAAEDAVGAGDLEGAIAAYEELLKQTPSDAEAKAGLAGSSWSCARATYRPRCTAGRRTTPRTSRRSSSSPTWSWSAVRSRRLRPPRPHGPADRRRRPQPGPAPPAGALRGRRE
jgi:putative thioredoxin